LYTVEMESFGEAFVGVNNESKNKRKTLRFLWK